MTNHTRRLIVGNNREEMDPSWAEVEEGLATLDGRTVDFVSLDYLGTESLWAGGGDGGKHIVVHMHDPESKRTRTLTDARAAGASVTLTVGGQSANYPARHTTGRKRVLRAFKHYFRTGRIPEDMTWEEGS